MAAAWFSTFFEKAFVKRVKRPDVVGQAGVDPVAGNPFYTLDLAAPIAACSASIVLPPVPAMPVINPRSLYWTHPDLPGPVCRFSTLHGRRAVIP